MTNQHEQSDLDFFRERCLGQAYTQIARDHANGWLTDRTRHGFVFGDIVQAVLAVDNVADAARFFRGYQAWLLTLEAEYGDGADHATVTAIAQSNIGWCFGEGMQPERISMWVEAAGAAHPVFGTKLPTPTEALRLGLAYGKKLRAQREALPDDPPPS